MDTVFPEALKALKDADPDVYELVQAEKRRQWTGIELIASENFTSAPVLEALGSCFSNKYSEGQPGARYYGGNEVVDKVELLCKKRALDAFHLDDGRWGVNVQPYSGSPANFAVYTALLKPHERVMGLDLPSGGHLTHGYYNALGKKISATSIYFESLPYKVHPETGIVDYDDLEKMALVFRPKMLICGASAYPRDWDYARMRSIADKVGAYLLCDMAHVSGLVSAGLLASPFELCDVVTTTTHKSLRGPRAGMIFYRKGAKPADRLKRGEAEGAEYAFEDAIDFAVFPSLQGGPHNHQIAALCVALRHCLTPEYGVYQRQVIANARALADTLTGKGYIMATGGTDNHLVLWDLRKDGVTGSKMQAACDAAHITLNMNSVAGDVSAMTPGGVRIGSPAMTSRGLKESEFQAVAEFLHRAVEVCKAVQKASGKKLVDFKAGLEKSEELAALRKDVEAFAAGFPMPGFSVKGL